MSRDGGRGGRVRRDEEHVARTVVSWRGRGTTAWELRRKGQGLEQRPGRGCGRPLERREEEGWEAVAGEGGAGRAWQGLGRPRPEKALAGSRDAATLQDCWCMLKVLTMPSVTSRPERSTRYSASRLVR